ncbi:MAG: hypothetical protein HGA42_17545 [Nostocales cyanobacterium W4_Combined_metabat2_030]|nr:hypothetical protein [Nostocales cyanobacterium W4_Combined_metabat2_030]
MILLSVKRLLFIGLMLLLIALNYTPAFAETSASITSIPESEIDIFSSVSLSQIGNSITLEELGLESWSAVPTKNTLNENQLKKMTIKLRNIARYLSGSWVIPITITPSNNELLQITDFRETGGNWKHLTAGHTLSLVMQEWKTRRTGGKQPLIDLLVKDEVSETYRPIFGVPLASYCSQLFHQLNNNI